VCHHSVSHTLEHKHDVCQKNDLGDWSLVHERCDQTSSSLRYFYIMDIEVEFLWRRETLLDPLDCVDTVLQVHKSPVKGTVERNRGLLSVKRLQGYNKRKNHQSWGQLR
jgi:hypothetical protein